MQPMQSQLKRRVGRPAGSGKQLPAVVRTRASRADRADQGAVRIDVTLDNATHDAVLSLMQHWHCSTKKETLERAIQAAASTIFKVD